MTTATKPRDLAAKLDGILGGNLFEGLTGLFEQMEWAEDEIKRAQRHNPAHADLIYHAFKVLTPSHELMRTRFVYESHCRELLARVIAGQDTRPGTAAEICAACCDASQVAPLTETAAGLYSRAWLLAFPGRTDDSFADAREHHEALNGAQIDELEAWSRRKLTQADRRVDFDCGGMHHGERVNCRGAAQLAAARKGQPAPAPEDTGQTEAEAAGMLFALTGTAA